MTKDKPSIVEVLSALINHPHLLEIKHKEFLTRANVLQIKDTYLILSEMEPKFYNSRLKTFDKVTISIKYISNTDLNSIEFHTKFEDFTSELGYRALRFSFPNEIENSSVMLDVQPDTSDNVSITFYIQNKINFKHVLSISKKRILFEGYYDNIIDKKSEVEIDQIELKLPFRRIIIYGKLKKESKNLYSINDYINNADKLFEINNYFQDYYSRMHKISIYNPENASIEVIPIGEQEALENQRANKPRIVIADGNHLVTDFIYDCLKSDNQYTMFLCNRIAELDGILQQVKPHLLIIDVRMPNQGIGAYIQELLSKEYAKSFRYFLLLGYTDVRSNYANIPNVVGMLPKPVNEQKIRMMLHNYFNL